MQQETQMEPLATLKGMRKMMRKTMKMRMTTRKKMICVFVEWEGRSPSPRCCQSHRAGSVQNQTSKKTYWTVRQVVGKD